ncbi:MAG: hypothetical protein QXO01_01255 [Nitrososphaerota archaeon]
MTERLFSTQEVGSLSKAPFLRKSLSEEHIRTSRDWAIRIGVEGFEDLISQLKPGIQSDEKLKSLEDWAALYGIRFHESAGLDIVYDGEQRRVEMYEYPLMHVKGFKFVGYIKVWDSEIFKKAAVFDKPSLIKPYHIEEFEFAKKKARRALKVPITGPYTLADWSFDEYYAKRKLDVDEPLERRRINKRDMVLDLAKEIIRPNLEALIRAGAKRIQIDEPAATTKPNEVDIFVEGFNEAVKGLDCAFSVHICYSDYRLLFPYILDLKAEHISIECANRDTKMYGRDEGSRPGYSMLKLFKEYGTKIKVAPGVIDVHTDFIESPELVRDRLLYAAKLLDDPAKIIASNDCGLRTRTWEVAYEKERALVAGAELARKEFE